MKTSSLVCYPMVKKIDENGQYTIKLSSGVELKGTKEEIELLINNLKRMIEG